MAGFASNWGGILSGPACPKRQVECEMDVTTYWRQDALLRSCRTLERTLVLVAWKSVQDGRILFGD